MSIEPKAPQPGVATSSGKLPEGEDFKRYIERRRLIGTIWRRLFFLCTVVGLVMLAMLLYNIVNSSFGTVAIQTRVAEEELTGGRDLESLSQEEFVTLLRENLRSARLRAIERQGGPLEDRDVAELEQITRDEILREELVASWSLADTVFRRSEIEATATERFPRAKLEFYSWVNRDFLGAVPSSRASLSGVGPAIAGSLWMILLTMLIAIPLGVSAAIYLEEYASTLSAMARMPNAPLRYRVVGWLSRIIQTNINNLAGVPSIIYGILGLAVFVRAFSHVTSGAAFGYTRGDPNVGRTILSAALTMSLLILPLIIINAQEAIRAVPSSIRQGSLALGATKWQTIWNQVLPIAFPGILTGVILSMSRALGETAPLVVIGAATFITVNPDGPFARFTALPIQIYQWATRPEAGFNNVSAAAIIVLLVMLLALNSIAVYLRNRFRRSI